LPNFNFKNRIDLASNGLQAVEAVKKADQNGQTYALILMDANMPHLDGYQATMQIREYITAQNQAQPRILGISGHVEEKYKQRALGAGMDSLIAKPAKVIDVKEGMQGVFEEVKSERMWKTGACGWLDL